LIGWGAYSMAGEISMYGKKGGMEPVFRIKISGTGIFIQPLENQ